ncbi:MAG TPA: ornithine carbamoyltransferase [Bryobacteraceae bacterium]|nr:ornithine carbamoyltransferase [Bryobacteraceae bacterium]
MAAMSSPNPLWKLQAQDVTRDLDLTTDEVLCLLELARSVKAAPGSYARALTGRYLTLLFEKPSLRTRLTFELAIKQLGGDCVTQSGPIADREPLRDVARNLDRWTQCIVARVFFQRTIDELAHWSSVPVVNALSDLYHPCQALADVLTIKERFGRLDGLKVAFIGDGNNVAHSLMLTCVRLGASFALATPESYEANRAIVEQTRELAAQTGATLTTSHDPAEAVSGAHVVYTDVWTSMGQESEGAARRQAFGQYQVNRDLFARARPEAVFMHCLPAKRGQETTDDVMEHPNSVIFDQAENRLHAQKALLLMLLA